MAVVARLKLGKATPRQPSNLKTEKGWQFHVGGTFFWALESRRKTLMSSHLRRVNRGPPRAELSY